MQEMLLLLENIWKKVLKVVLMFILKKKTIING